MGRIADCLVPSSSLAHTLSEIGSINGHWILISIDYCEPHSVFLFNSPFNYIVINEYCCPVSELNIISNLF